MRFSGTLAGVSRNQARRFSWLAGLLLAVIFNPALAAEEETAVWSILSTSDNITNDGKATRWRYTAATQWRSFQQGAGTEQYLLRGSIGYTLKPGMTLSAGFDYFLTDPDGGGTRYERRPWQQFAWSAKRWDWGSLLLRWRLEQRDLENSNDTGQRFRQMAQFTIPVRTNDMTGVLSVEHFVNLNDSDAGARSGFDQVRAYSGLRFPLTNRASFEAGYMMQYINRTNRRDLINHSAMLHLRVKFR